MKIAVADVKDNDTVTANPEDDQVELSLDIKNNNPEAAEGEYFVDDIITIKVVDADGKDYTFESGMEVSVSDETILQKLEGTAALNYKAIAAGNVNLTAIFNGMVLCTKDITIAAAEVSKLYICPGTYSVVGGQLLNTDGDIVEDYSTIESTLDTIDFNDSYTFVIVSVKASGEVVELTEGSSLNVESGSDYVTVSDLTATAVGSGEVTISGKNENFKNGSENSITFVVATKLYICPAWSFSPVEKNLGTVKNTM